jgi:hypothetical protein
MHFHNRNVENVICQKILWNEQNLYMYDKMNSEFVVIDEKAVLEFEKVLMFQSRNSRLL